MQQSQNMSSTKKRGAQEEEFPEFQLKLMVENLLDDEPQLRSEKRPSVVKEEAEDEEEEKKFGARHSQFS